MQMFFRVCNVVFILYLCSTILRMYRLCYNVINYRASHQLKLSELHVAHIEYLASNGNKSDSFCPLNLTPFIYQQ